MAKKALIEKAKKHQRFSSRRYSRCLNCGRPHAFMREYKVCRICFRKLAYNGQIPGVKKAS